MNSDHRAPLALLVSALLVSCASAPPPTVRAPAPRPAELQAITQAMADAVAPGDVATWDRYTDAALTYVSEDGDVKNKADLLAELKPLPPGLTGTIHVAQFQVRDLGELAVTTYVMEEIESVEGQVLHARYRQTDTWRVAFGAWKLVAAQVLAVNKDPPAVTLSANALDGYAGTYARSASTQIVVRRDGDHLLSERAGRPPQTMRPEAVDVFFTPDRPRTRQLFHRAADGTVTGFSERREGEDLLWTKR